MYFKYFFHHGGDCIVNKKNVIKNFSLLIVLLLAFTSETYALTHEALVISGIDNLPLTNHSVQVYKIHKNGKRKNHRKIKTDEQGILTIDFPKVDTETKFVLRARPRHGKDFIYSEEMSTADNSEFRVANMRIKTVNGRTNTTANRLKVTAYIRENDGSDTKINRFKTDNLGIIDFQLPALTEGQKVFFKAINPITRKLTSSSLIEAPGLFIFEFNEDLTNLLKVSVTSGVDNLPLSNQAILFYKINTDGSRKAYRNVSTDAQGLLSLDLPGLGDATTQYELRSPPRHGSRVIYSGAIDTAGDYAFKVANMRIKLINGLTDGIVKNHKITAYILDASGSEIWITHSNTNALGITDFQLPELAAGQQYLFKAASLNDGQTLKSPLMGSLGTEDFVIDAHLGTPIITITSHNQGDQVDEHGFLLSGTVADNASRDVTIFATVIDPIQGTIIDHKELDIGQKHHWALTAKNLSRNQNITVTLEASDSDGNVTNNELSLSVISNNLNIIQLVNRITYGVTPQLLKEIRNQGAEYFLQQQLHPELIDDSVFENEFSSRLANVRGGAYLKLNATQILHASFSKRQLLEVMTQFWESHFNTDLTKTHNVLGELATNELYRQNALGNFKNLLQITATSVPMLLYLDNVYSYKEEPNENYARELLELHTLGVDGGYTSEDIAEVARVFTGWTVEQGQFKFTNEYHDDGEKTILGTVIPANSNFAGGEILLDTLSKQPATAKYICTKLLTLLISDSPEESAILNCATEFLLHADEENQIALVLEEIIKSSYFSDSLNFHNKVKTPFEFMVGLYRQLPLEHINYSNARTKLASLGMPLFLYPLPTGWPEKANELIDSNRLMQRWEVSNIIMFDPVDLNNIYLLNPEQFFIDQGIETTEGILGYLFELILDHDYSTLEWNEARSLLTSGNPTDEFDIYASDADGRLRNLMAIMMQYPSYQLH